MRDNFLQLLTAVRGDLEPEREVPGRTKDALRLADERIGERAEKAAYERITRSPKYMKLIDQAIERAKKRPL